MSLTKVSYSMINGAVANVLDFNADNTGVVDSSAAFIAAIASLPALGGTVYVPNGIYKIDATINITKSVYLILDAVTINFTVAPGINHTDKDLCISGSGQTSSILTSNANGDLIYSASGAGTANSGLYKLSIDNIRLKDLLTIQAGVLFTTWSTTRTVGAGLNIVGTPFNVKNVYTFGFFDAIRIVSSVASTLESCWCFWSARHSFNIGQSCTSLTLTGTYSFAPQENGYNLIETLNYSTFNSTASDSAGRFGYYLGPGPLGFSPNNLTFNSIGCEEAGSRITDGASIGLDGVRNILFNETLITGIPQSRLVNTTSGFSTYNTSGNFNAFVTINGGQIGTAAIPLGGNGINLPAGTCAGSNITILTNPNEIAGNVVDVFDPDGALWYAQNQDFEVVAAATATPVTLFTFPNGLPVGSYLVTTFVNLGTAANWTVVDLVTIQLTTSTLTNLKAGIGLTTSMTGLDFKATQTSGSAQTISCKISRIG